MTFDAARSLSEAFNSIGKEPTAPTPEAPKAEAPKAPETKTEAPKAEPVAEPTKEEAPATADADALAELLGGPKKAEAKPEPDDAPPEGAMTEAAMKRWAEQRKALKEERHRREELEAKVAELEKRSTDVAPDEVKALRETVDAYERELQIARVEATKEFKDAVAVPRERINGQLESFAKKYEFREADARVAFAEADPEKQTELLVDMASGMNDRDRMRFYAMAEEWQKVEGIANKVRHNAKLALEKIQEHHTEQQNAFIEQRNKQYRGALEKIWGDVSEKAPLFRRREGDDAWNQKIGEIEQFATGLDWNTVADNDQARAEVALRAAASPFLYGLVQQLFAKTAELNKTLSKYQSAKPGAGGGAADPIVGSGQEEKVEHEDFFSAIKSGLS
jgi:gas vesicle protein